MSSSFLLVVVLLFQTVWAGWRDPPDFQDGSDLEHFVTRPDLRAPRYMVTKYHVEDIAPGYWFVSPYTHLDKEANTSRREHIPYQTGPHIYDGDGNLVWSGACKYGNRNVFGFKPVDVNGVQHLSFHLPEERLGNDIPRDHRKASGVVMNNRYEEISRATASGTRRVDIHEFGAQADGKTVLLSTYWRVEKDASEIGQGKRNLTGTGFQEIDLSTGNLEFDWDPLAHGVLLNESCDTTGRAPNFTGHYWDFFHLNSVDKNAHGDYLVSGRHTSTIYKVSGQDGRVIWRLGGDASDFVMEENLPFHWQHDARFRFENETHSIISVFDNAGDDRNRNSQIPQARSVGKIMVLDTASNPMTAKMLRRFNRPDGDRSPRLGSLQTIGDDISTAHVFVNWAEQGYISEYDAQDRLVLEARFQSKRMATYRAYKYPFVGRPTGVPAFRLLPVGYGAHNDVASALYVSWNGATEVASWAFYGGDDRNKTFQLLAKVRKHGFETSWILPHVVRHAYAEAMDANGEPLARSAVSSIVPPVDGDFKIIAPLLEEHEPPLDESSPPDQASDDGKAMSAWTALVLVVASFALFGLYCMLRAFGRLVVWRPRSGYRSLSTPARSL